MSSMEVNMLQKLPEGVQTQVAGLVSQMDRGRLLSVNKHQNRVLQNPQLWTNVDLSAESNVLTVDDSVLRHFACNAQNGIVSLNLWGRFIAETPEMAAPSMSHFDNISLNCLIEVLRANGGLKRLVVSGWLLDDFRTQGIRKSTVDRILAAAPGLELLECMVCAPIQDVSALLLNRKMRVKRLEITRYHDVGLPASPVSRTQYNVALEAIRGYEPLEGLTIHTKLDDYEPWYTGATTVEVINLAKGRKLIDFGLVLHGQYEMDWYVWRAITDLIEAGHVLDLGIKVVRDRFPYEPTINFCDAIGKSLKIQHISMHGFRLFNDDAHGPHSGSRLIAALSDHRPLKFVALIRCGESLVDPQGPRATAVSNIINGMCFALHWLVAANAPTLDGLALTGSAFPNLGPLFSALEQNNNLRVLLCDNVKKGPAGPWPVDSEALQYAVRSNTSLLLLKATGCNTRLVVEKAEAHIDKQYESFRYAQTLGKPERADEKEEQPVEEDEDENEEENEEDEEEEDD